MRRTLFGTFLVLFLAGAFCLALGDAPRDQPPACQSRAGLGTLKLYPSSTIVHILIQDSMAPRLFVDGEFVGNYEHPNSPPHFRLPAGKHRVRVELEGFKPFESEIHLIGNDSIQYLCFYLEKQ
jgi:hypothetical protein